MECEYKQNGQERQAYSLLELNNRVRKAVVNAFPDTCWIRAEMSDVRTNASSGHCYLEFIEKHPVTGQLVARARGSIWAKTFRMVKPYFELETGQLFTSGLKVLVKVSVEFHELYGYSLTVLDIDPAYTLGDLVRKRQEIIRQLKEEGVFSLNKELPFPTLPKRIAVITSPTAAGYEDFMNQLANNKAGYPFYVRLFPALMQGERTEESVIAALDHVYQHVDHFDVVVIIRGGGATSDLSSFDSYLLAANCAQFPLPVITGIGHERDDTVLDMVAHTRMKTPTAVAEFLISQMDRAADELNTLQQFVSQFATDELVKQQAFLQLLGSRLPVLALNQIERNRSLLQRVGNQLPVWAATLLSKKKNTLDTLSLHLKNRMEGQLKEQERWLQLTEQFVKMASPDYLLKRGYSLTLRAGKIVKEAKELAQGDELFIRFSDGDVEVEVKTNPKIESNYAEENRNIQ
ncbi:MAG: exodeoxyribonuclease VII large subunit [Parabacteroides sp.]|nr:exodeoxyribonuclease VII large subunit [Parabacteroides sp.]